MPVLNGSVSLSTVDAARDLGLMASSHLAMAALHKSALCAVLYFFNFWNRSQLMLLRLWSMRLFQLVWTTAIHFCTASPTTCSDAYRPFKMLRALWLPVCVWAHHASYEAASLATGQAASGFQIQTGSAWNCTRWFVRGSRCRAILTAARCDRGQSI